jgi:hypothetical protein
VFALHRTPCRTSRLPRLQRVSPDSGPHPPNFPAPLGREGLGVGVNPTFILLLVQSAVHCTVWFALRQLESAILISYEEHEALMSGDCELNQI